MERIRLLRKLFLVQNFRWCWVSLTRVEKLPKSKMGLFFRGCHCSRTRGYWPTLVPGLFLPVQVANGDVSACHCATGLWRSEPLQKEMNVEEVFGAWRGTCWNMTFAVHYSPTYGKMALVVWPFSLLSQRMMIFPSIPCFLSMQLRHTCYSASVMINLLLPPSSPKLHVQSIHKAWSCHQCCIACGMILTHHANWCFSSST